MSTNPKSQPSNALAEPTMRVLQYIEKLDKRLELAGYDMETRRRVIGLMMEVGETAEPPLPEQEKSVDVTSDLTMLTVRLARRLASILPDDDLPKKAMSFIERKGLKGTPLRDDAASIVADGSANTQVKMLRDDLIEAATILRKYEAYHRAKSTAESIEKAEVNASLAGRFEKTIAATIDEDAATCNAARLESAQWSYSTNEERYQGGEDSREAIIQVAISEIGEDAGTFWIGKNRHFAGRGNSGLVIESLQEQASDECGESAETYLTDVTQDEEAELSNMITAWAARVDRSNFWTVYDVEKIDIETIISAK